MKLAIIIVNYNGAKFVLNSIKSVIKFPGSILIPEIVFVDNASSDNSLEVLHSFISSFTPGSLPVKIEVIANSKNVGFGRANNIAFSKVDADYYFLLNPDAEVDKETIDKLVKFLQNSSDVALVAPIIFDEKGERIDSVWSDHKGKILHFILNTFGLIRFFPRKIQRKLNYRGADEKKPCEVDIVSGAAMLLTKEAVKITKGFDEDFFMYGEDIDICMRIRRAKKKIIFFPNVHVFHEGGKSSSTTWTNIEKERVMTSARICLWRKHYSSFKVKVFLGISAFVYFIKFLYVGARTFGKSKYDIYKIYLASFGTK